MGGRERGWIEIGGFRIFFLEFVFWGMLGVVKESFERFIFYFEKERGVGLDL